MALAAGSTPAHALERAADALVGGGVRRAVLGGERLPRFEGGVAERHEPLQRRVARAARGRCDTRAGHEGRADLVLQLALEVEDDALGGALADAGARG